MRNMVHLMLLMIVVRMLSSCSLAPIPERIKNEPKKYALLIGGGDRECDNFESFYANIEYVYNTLKKLGYHDEDIKILFHGGKTLCHPIVEGCATKKNVIAELSHLGNIMESNDSLLIFRSGHGTVELMSEKYDKFSDYENRFETESIKFAGTLAVMNFPDGNLLNSLFKCPNLHDFQKKSAKFSVSFRFHRMITKIGNSVK